MAVRQEENHPYWFEIIDDYRVNPLEAIDNIIEKLETRVKELGEPDCYPPWLPYCCYDDVDIGNFNYTDDEPLLWTL